MIIGQSRRTNIIGLASKFFDGNQEALVRRRSCRLLKKAHGLRSRHKSRDTEIGPANTGARLEYLRSPREGRSGARARGDRPHCGDWQEAREDLCSKRPRWRDCCWGRPSLWVREPVQLNQWPEGRPAISARSWVARSSKAARLRRARRNVCKRSRRKRAKTTQKCPTAAGRCRVAKRVCG